MISEIDHRLQRGQLRGLGEPTTRTGPTGHGSGAGHGQRQEDRAYARADQGVLREIPVLGTLIALCPYFARK